MSDFRKKLGRFSALATISVFIAGCTTLHNAGVPGLEMYIKKDAATVQFERSQREKFSIDRDHQALYWLLSNRVDNGMSLSEVEDILGGPGEATSDLNYMKSEGLHQTTDTAYKWGPDSKGNSVVIFFRENRVSNFNPKDYQKL